MERIRIKARGFAFDALADGPEDGPLILLLHGLARTSWEWHHQLPRLAEAGFRVVAPDQRGYSPGARPHGVEAYTVDEFAKDALAIADELGWADRPFHLMAGSVGAIFAWRAVAIDPQRVATLACINIPHPGAFAEVAQSAFADEQEENMSYHANSRKEGSERETFERIIKKMGLPAEETDPYLEALNSDEALRAVFHFYRANTGDGAIPAADPIAQMKPVLMPTLFIWPPAAGTVSRRTAEANARYVEGPYRFEILGEAMNFALQKTPEKITRLLLEHLAEHAG